MKQSTIKFHWWCPYCGTLHNWEWDAWDIPESNDPITMACDDEGKEGGCESTLELKWQNSLLGWVKSDLEDAP